MDDFNPMKEDYDSMRKQEKRVLYVNLKNSLEEHQSYDAVKSVFREYGRTESIRVNTERKCAFITYETVEEAVEAKNSAQGINKYYIAFGKQDNNKSSGRPPSNKNYSQNNDFRRDNFSQDKPRKPMNDDDDDGFGKAPSQNQRNDSFSKGRPSNQRPPEREQPFQKAMNKPEPEIRSSSARKCQSCSRTPNISCLHCSAVFCSPKCYKEEGHDPESCKKPSREEEDFVPKSKPVRKPLDDDDDFNFKGSKKELKTPPKPVNRRDDDDFDFEDNKKDFKSQRSDNFSKGRPSSTQRESFSQNKGRQPADDDDDFPKGRSSNQRDTNSQIKGRKPAFDDDDDFGSGEKKRDFQPPSRNNDFSKGRPSNQRDNFSQDKPRKPMIDDDDDDFGKAPSQNQRNDGFSKGRPSNQRDTYSQERGRKPLNDDDDFGFEDKKKPLQDQRNDNFSKGRPSNQRDSYSQDARKKVNDDDDFDFKENKRDFKPARSDNFPKGRPSNQRDHYSQDVRKNVKDADESDYKENKRDYKSPSQNQRSDDFPKGRPSNQREGFSQDSRKNVKDADDFDNKQPKSDYKSPPKKFPEGRQSNRDLSKDDEDENLADVPKNILSNCEVGDKIIARFIDHSSYGSVSLVIPKEMKSMYEKLCVEFCEVCDKLPKSRYTAKRGEVVAVKTETGWFRAVTVPNNRWLLLDDGSEVASKDITGVVECPAKYKTQPGFVVLLSDVMDPPKNMVKIEIISKRINDVKVAIIGPKDEIIDRSIVRPWPFYFYDELFSKKLSDTEDDVKKPSKSAPIESAPRGNVDLIRDKGLVLLMSFKCPNIVFVRPADPKSDELYSQILTIIASEGQKAETLHNHVRALDQNMMYMVKNQEQKMFYRCYAEPYRGSTEKVIVTYLDIVKRDLVPLNSLFPACSTVVKLPRMIQQIHLADVDEVTIFPHKIEAYFQWLKDRPLKCTLNDDVGEMKSVTLIIDSNNANVNKKVQSLITPVWKKMEINGFDILDVEYAMTEELPDVLFESTHRLLIKSHEFLDEGRLAISPQSKKINMELKWFNYEINELCSRLPDPYNPRKGEICAFLTKDRTWVRAECEGVEDNSEVKVMLVDDVGFFRTNYRNIRKLPGLLALHLPRTMLIAQLAGLPKSISDSLLKKLSDLLPVGEVIADFEYDSETMKLTIPSVSDFMRSKMNR